MVSIVSWWIECSWRRVLNLVWRSVRGVINIYSNLSFGSQKTETVAGTSLHNLEPTSSLISLLISFDSSLSLSNLLFLLAAPKSISCWGWKKGLPEMLRWDNTLTKKKPTLLRSFLILLKNQKKLGSLFLCLMLSPSSKLKAGGKGLRGSRKRRRRRLDLDLNHKYKLYAFKNISHNFINLS